MKIIFRFAVVAALFVLLAAEPTRLTEAAPVHINNATDVATESSKQPPLTSEQVEKPVEQPKPAPTPVPKPQINLTKQEIMSAAGIPESEWAAVDYILTKESGWRHLAVNKSSGATGLCQSLPASKMATAGSDYLTNPVTQMKWCNSYAISRYGGWWAAHSFWLRNHWW
jgi:hypothetical protein